MREAIEILLYAVGAYLSVGVLFAIAFVGRGAAALDVVARGTPLKFKVLIAPGSAALWPVLLFKWRQALRARREPTGGHP